jgi:hypothetical protein
MRARFGFIRDMRRLIKFASVSASERRLLLRSVLVVVAIRLALWLLPFSAVQERVARPSGKPARQCHAAKSIVWAVRAVSRCVPSATCLTQAMAAQVLLARSGHISRVQIGVAKNSDCFQAHAWLVCEEELLLGGKAAERYVPLTAWEAKG